MQNRMRMSFSMIFFLLTGPVAFGWTQVGGGGFEGDIALAVRADANGDVFAAGTVAAAFSVLKMRGDNGALLARQDFAGTGGSGIANAMDLTAEGDVVAAGQWLNRDQDPDPGWTMGVVKLRGDDLSFLWRREILEPSPGLGSAFAVRVDMLGEVIVGGYVGNSFTVAKLDGSTGEEIWRQYLISSHGWVTDLAVDAVGNIAAVGTVEYVFTVAKLDGSSGVILWRTDLGSPGSQNLATSVAIDSKTSDVIAVGQLRNIGTGLDGVAVRLESATGNQLWRTDVQTTSADGFFAIAPDLTGDFAVTGLAGGNFTVMKLAGGDGMITWRTDVPTDPGGKAVVVDGAGDVIAGGIFTGATSSS